MRGLTLFMLLATAVRATGNLCTLNGPAGSACASKTCSLAAIAADTGHSNWTGSGCTANGYVPNHDGIVAPNGYTLNIDRDIYLANGVKGGDGFSAGAGVIYGYQVVSAGGGYSGTCTATISGGGGNYATATVYLNGSGGIGEVRPNEWGQGYTSEPSVSISCTGGGSGASVRAYSMPALACTVAHEPNVDSGVVNILAGAHVTYAGPVIPCNSTWTVGAGAHLTHDGSANGVSYAWGGSGYSPTTFTINGTAAQPVVWDNAPGSPSGYWGQPAWNSAAVNWNYLDASAMAAPWARTWSFNNGSANSTVTVSNSKLGGQTNVISSATSTHTFSYTQFLNPNNYGDLASALYWTQLANPTTGARALSNYRVYGTFVGAIQGLTSQHGMLEPSLAAQTNYHVSWGQSTGGSNQSVTKWDDTFDWYMNYDLKGDLSYIPNGPITDWFGLRASGIGNTEGYQQVVNVPGAFNLNGFVCDNLDTGQDGSCIIPSTAAAGSTQTIRGLMALPGPMGNSIKAITVVSGTTTNVAVRAYNNGWFGGASTIAPGAGIEGNSGKAGEFSVLANNIAFPDAAATGPAWIVHPQGGFTVSVAGTFQGADYNAYPFSDGTSAYYAPGPISASQMVSNPSLSGSPLAAPHDIGAVDPRMPDIKRKGWLFPSEYLGLQGTICSGACSDWSSATTYPSEAIVYHTPASYWDQRRILWRCIATAGCPAGGVEPGAVASGLPRWLGTWEPYVVELMRQKMTANPMPVIFEGALGCGGMAYPNGCSYNQALLQWIRQGWTPQNPKYWTSGCGSPAQTGSGLSCSGLAGIGPVDLSSRAAATVAAIAF